MSIYSQISQNKVKTYLIMGLFVVFVSLFVYVLSQALGYNSGMVIFAFVFALISSVGSYYFSDSMVLALSGAKQLENTAGRDVYDIVENISIAAGLPMPKVYLINDPAPNAFATGRDPQHATVCVTSGLLTLLNKSELEGVIAHELSHVKNFDTRLMMVGAVLVGLVSILGNLFFRTVGFRGSDDNRRAGQIFLLLGIVFALLSPIIATIIQLTISRKREFLADASGAYLTRYPEGLASALEKLSESRRTLATADTATAHLFIVNPFAGKSATSFFANLFSTHPPIEERVKILRAM